MPHEIKCVSVLALQSTFYTVAAASILVGYVRAATVINQNLTISENCDDAKLPAALGLNMVAKGVIVLSVGQFLGKSLFMFIRLYSFCKLRRVGERHIRQLQLLHPRAKHRSVRRGGIVEPRNIHSENAKRLELTERPIY